MNWKMFVILVIALTSSSVQATRSPRQRGTAGNRPGVIAAPSGYVIGNSDITDIAITDPSSCALRVVCGRLPSSPYSIEINGKPVCVSDRPHGWFVEFGNQREVPVSISATEPFSITIKEVPNTCRKLTSSGCFNQYSPENAITGEFQSKNFPSNYPPNEYCTYRFQNSSGICGVKIVSMDFDVDEPEGVCAGDYFEIQNKIYCGNARVEGTYKLPIDAVFTSDASNEASGFRFYYVFLRTCEKSCDEVYEDWAAIVTPKLDDGGDRVKKNATCNYTIKKKPDAKCLKIEFTDMKLEGDGNHIKIDGTVYIKNTTTNASKTNVFGLKFDGTFPMIKFQTGKTVMDGEVFILKYTQLKGQGDNCRDATISCGDVPDEPMFTLRNPGYPVNYPSNYKCYYLIKPVKRDGRMSAKVQIILQSTLAAGDTLMVNGQKGPLDPMSFGSTIKFGPSGFIQIHFESDRSNESTFEIVVIHSM